MGKSRKEFNPNNLQALQEKRNKQAADKQKLKLIDSATAAGTEALNKPGSEVVITFASIFELTLVEDVLTRVLHDVDQTQSAQTLKEAIKRFGSDVTKLQSTFELINGSVIYLRLESEAELTILDAMMKAIIAANAKA